MVADTPGYFSYYLFINIFIMNGLSKNGRMKLAIEAFNKGQFKSKTACAKAFDVAPKTLMGHLNGTTSRKESIANY